MNCCVTFGPQTPERLGLALTTLKRWLDLHIRPVVHDVCETPEFTDIARELYPQLKWVMKPREGSQRNRHLWAEEECADPIYILADDDAWIIPQVFGSEEPWEEYVVRIMDQYHLVSACPWIVPDKPWPPPKDDLWHGDREVRKDRSVGCIRFVRKGFVGEDLPPQTEAAYDGPRNRHLNRFGLLGILGRVRCHHAGWRMRSL